MSDHLHWMGESETILILRIPEYWSWSEMYIWLAEVSAILDARPYKITVIIDFQRSVHIPKNALLNSQPILRHLHPNADPIILAGLSSGHRAIFHTISLLHPNDSQRLVIVDNIEAMISQG